MCFVSAVFDFEESFVQLLLVTGLVVWNLVTFDSADQLVVCLGGFAALVAAGQVLSWAVMVGSLIVQWSQIWLQ